MSDEESSKPESRKESLEVGEYRLVPVDEGAAAHTEEEIDLVEVIRYLWDRRKTVYRITGGFLVLGLFIALFSPVDYQTEATLMPEMQNQEGGASRLLEQYGGMLGIGGGGAQAGSNQIPPNLYPRIVQSVPFQQELMETPVTFDEYDTTATPQVFFTEIYGTSLVGYAKQYTIGLPGKVISLIKPEEEKTRVRSQTPGEEQEIIELSKEEMEVINTLRQRITANVDQETGIITVSAALPDPQAAAEVGQQAIEQLKQYVREYKTQKAKQNLEFVEQQHQRAKKEFHDIQEQLATFRDKHQNLATARAQTELERLQDQKQLAFNVYNSLSQRYEQAKIDVNEETPAFKVLQPVQVPLEKSSPNRKLVMVISLILGVVTSVGFLLVRSFWRRVEGEFRE